MRFVLLFVLLGFARVSWADDCTVSTNAPNVTGYNDTKMSCNNRAALRAQLTDSSGNEIGTASNPVPVSGTISTAPDTPSTAGPTSITATQCSTLTALKSQATVSVLITGTWTGTITASKSVDGTTFSTARLTAQPLGTTGSGSSVTANGTYTIDSAGMATVKVCGNTVGSGTAVVSLRTNTGAETSVDGLAMLGGSAGVPATTVITTQPPTESTAVTVTTVLAGADATISAADTTSAERLITNNGSATAYIALGATAVSGTGVRLDVGQTYIEDRYRGAIHAIGTGAIDVQKVSP